MTPSSGTPSSGPPPSGADGAGTAAAVRPAVNDFTINVATVNGTGSQTANNTLIRAIMRMGVPVSGKNVFPSNIQGLPTWFVIRASEAGWLAPTERPEVVVCMNRDTADEDVHKCPAGGWVIYDEPLKLSDKRDDVTFFPMPVSRLVKDVCPPKLWRLVQNMIYVGVTAHLVGIDVEAIDAALDKAFAAKPKAAEVNKKAVRRGMRYAAETFADAPGTYRIERRDLTEGKILIDGNSAAALGALMGGCTVLTWYPITPSSSVAESFEALCKTYRHDADGNARYAILQAEDELAAIGMVLGAGWAGARAMTTTSGPGVSLMSEFIGLSYYAEIPGVIVNVQRVGPSTGLPTRTMQCDLIFCAYNSHGDTKHPMLLPASPQEAYELMQASFDVAERFQTLCFFVSDLDLGMNNWLADPFPYPSGGYDRGKVIDAEKLAELGAQNWGRYKDVDGDGVPWRSLPGTELPGAAYFTRGSGHNEYARYTESGDAYVRNVDRLARKFETMREYVPAPVRDDAPNGSKVGLIAFGTTHWAVLEARVELAEAHGVTFDYLRLRAFPFAKSVRDFIEGHDVTYVVEQNRDAQMLTLLRNDMPDLTDRLRSVVHYDGMPIHAGAVVEGLLEGTA